MVQWRGRRRSSNVEDGRGQRPARGTRMGAGGFKLKGGIGTIVLVAIVYFAGGDLTQILGLLMGGGGGGAPSMGSNAPGPSVPSGQPANDEGAQFVSVILADTEDTWRAVFQKNGSNYPEPKLRLFTGSVSSACGNNSAAVGPFYCPPDQRVYLDLSFFDQLRSLGAPGDFAQAYVIGHEIGHHVQNITGTLNAVQAMKRGRSERESNQLQVLVELQADCYAGMWAYHAETQRDLLENGDVEEGLKAAASIGDDALQRRAGRSVRPDGFTHGSSAQRVQWFKRGMESGELQSCDTFGEAGVRLNVGSTSGSSSRTQSSSQNNQIAKAMASQTSDVQVRGEGRVVRVLSDDNKGSRHQRFILDVGAPNDLLIAHNIDLSQRIGSLREGDQVAFYGEYEYTSQGGVVHWTHHDPGGRHTDGWLEHEGQRYN